MVMGPDGATEPSNNLSVIGGRVGNALQEELLSNKFWSINEQVHPLSIRTLIGEEDKVGTRRERTSWCDCFLGEEKEEKALQGQSSWVSGA
jgi:hypothetical protein